MLYVKQNNKIIKNGLISKWKKVGRKDFGMSCLHHKEMLISIIVLT